MTNWWRRYPKRTWEPCCYPRCPDPTGGPVAGSRNVTPTRISGRRFGIEGVLCHRCYTLLATREQTARRRALGGPARRSKHDREAA